jgi:hypothetical protein
MLLTIFVILLVLWLVGLIGNFTFGGAIHLLLLVAVVALVLSAADGARGRAGRIRLNASIGLVLAGIWFLLMGLFQLFGFTFLGQDLVMSILALAAGVLLVLGR